MNIGTFSYNQKMLRKFHNENFYLITPASFVPVCLYYAAIAGVLILLHCTITATIFITFAMTVGYIYYVRAKNSFIRLLSVVTLSKFEVTISIDEDVCTFTSGKRSSTMPWSDIESVRQSSDYLTLVLAHKQHIIVPIPECDKESRDAFLSHVSKV